MTRRNFFAAVVGFLGACMGVKTAPMCVPHVLSFTSVLGSKWKAAQMTYYGPLAITQAMIDHCKKKGLVLCLPPPEIS